MNHGSVAGLKCSATYRFFKVYESNPKPLENPRPHDSTNSKTDLLGLTRNLVVPVSAPAPAGPAPFRPMPRLMLGDSIRGRSLQSLADCLALYSTATCWIVIASCCTKAADCISHRSEGGNVAMVRVYPDISRIWSGRVQFRVSRLNCVFFVKSDCMFRSNRTKYVRLIQDTFAIICHISSIIICQQKRVSVMVKEWPWQVPSTWMMQLWIWVEALHSCDALILSTSFTSYKLLFVSFWIEKQRFFCLGRKSIDL